MVYTPPDGGLRDVEVALRAVEAFAGDVPPGRVGRRELDAVRRPSPVTPFIECGRVSQRLDGLSKTLSDST